MFVVIPTHSFSQFRRKYSIGILPVGRLKLFILSIWIFFRSNPELLDPWEVLFDDISLHRIVGEGAFGKVYRGQLLKQLMEVGKGRKSLMRKADKEQQQKKKGLTVAVKMLQSKICFFQLKNLKI